MNNDELIKAIKLRPGMFFTQPEPSLELKAENIIVSLIDAILREGVFKYRNLIINLNARFESLYLSIEGLSLNINEHVQSPPPIYFRENTGLTDWLINQVRERGPLKEDPLRPFQYLYYVLHVCDISVLEVSDSQNGYRQSFYKGQPISPCLNINLKNNPRLSAHLYLDPLVMATTVLNLPNLLDEFHGLIEKYESSHKVSNEKINKISDQNFIFTFTLERRKKNIEN